VRSLDGVNTGHFSRMRSPHHSRAELQSPEDLQMSNRKRKWTPKSRMQRRWAAQDRATWNRWHTFKACTDPWWRAQDEAVDHQPLRIRKGAYDQVEKHTRDLALYAAAIGAKRGALLLNLAGVRATISERKADCATVLFDRQNDRAADSRSVWVRVGQVTIGNLDAWPSEPVQELDCDLPAAA